MSRPQFYLTVLSRPQFYLECDFCLMSYMSLGPLYSYASCTTIVVSLAQALFSRTVLRAWSAMEKTKNPLKVFMGQLRPDITQQTISDVTAGLGLLCKSIHVVPGSRFQVWRLRIQS